MELCCMQVFKEDEHSREFRKYDNLHEMTQEQGLFLIQTPSEAKGVSKIVNEEGFISAEF